MRTGLKIQAAAGLMLAMAALPGCQQVQDADNKFDNGIHAMGDNPVFVNAFGTVAVDAASLLRPSGNRHSGSDIVRNIAADALITVINEERKKYASTHDYLQARIKATHDQQVKLAAQNAQLNRELDAYRAAAARQDAVGQAQAKANATAILAHSAVPADEAEKAVSMNRQIVAIYGDAPVPPRGDGTTPVAAAAPSDSTELNNTTDEFESAQRESESIQLMVVELQ